MWYYAVLEFLGVGTTRPELSRLIWLSLGTRIYFDTNRCLQQEKQYHDKNHLSESSSLIEVYYDGC